MAPARLVLASALAAGVSCQPTMPSEYTAVVQMKMPYFGLEMPLRVLTSLVEQKVEYYDGLEVNVLNANGTYKYAFNNSERVCLYSPPSGGPMSRRLAASGAPAWTPAPFLPNLSSYTLSGTELVGGIACEKYTLDASHGTVGTMDDHISFYWDPVLGKPVRWHMHARQVTFPSHTDEYIMDYLSFQPGTPSKDGLAMPPLCAKQPRVADVSFRVRDFLQAAQALKEAPASRGASAAPSFEGFVRQHGKSYAAGELEHRRAVFERNAHRVQELNAAHAGGARFRTNRFADLTREEVMSFRGGKAKTLRAQRRTKEHMRWVRTFEASGAGVLAAGELPKMFDWRAAKPGVVGPVKDQAMCGSCWTYGLMEPIESIQAIRTGKLTILPEQFAVDCTWTNGTGDSGSNSGCDGGDSDIGALEIVRKYGGVVPTAKAYGSYLSINGYCKDTRLMEVGAKITGWVDVEARNETAVMQALVSQGPLSISIQVPDEMLYYDSGVLKVDSCRHNTTQIDHSVVLTGFGTDESGTDYWVVRNSWSTYWGDKGYIKVARGELDCCISCEAGYPEVDAAAVSSSSIVV